MRVLEVYAATFIVLFSNLKGAESVDAVCLDILREQAGTIMADLIPCIKDSGYAFGQERADHFYCITKCLLKKAGALSDDGKINVRQAMSVAFGMESVPLEILEKGLSAIIKCAKFSFGNLEDAADTKCLKYQPLISCGINNLLDLCGPLM